MMTFLYLISFLTAGITLGLAVVNWIDRERHLGLGEMIAGAFTAGFIILVFMVLGLAVLTKNLSIAIQVGIIAGLALGIFELLHHNFYRSRFQEFRYRFQLKHLFFMAVAVLFLGVALQTIILDKNGFPNSSYISWGDSSYHLSMIGKFAYGEPFDLTQPIANGESLTYPFLVNLFSGILLRIGLPLIYAWYIPLLLFGIAMLVLLYFLAHRIFGKYVLAVCFIFLILVGGGLGFWQYFKDVQTISPQNGLLGGAKELLVNPMHDYTHLDNRTGGQVPNGQSTWNIVWIAPAISFFSHQRSFAVGFSLLLFILLGWLASENDRHKGKTAVRYLPLLGFLPLSHGHTAIAALLIFTTLFIATLIRSRKTALVWLLGAAAAAVIALPQIALIFNTGAFGSGAGTSFFKPFFGWMTCTHNASWFFCDPKTAGTDSNIFWFWTKNFGIIFWGWLTAIAYLCFKKKFDRITLLLIIDSALIFVVSNVILFQPWEFDNNKILFYWWFFSLLVIFLALKELFPRRRMVTVLLLVLLILGGLSGTIDALVRLNQTVTGLTSNEPLKNRAGFYGPDEVITAVWIIKNTAANDAFLTTDSPNNFVPMLTGRPIFLGFSGWLWSQGRYDIATQRESAAKRMFVSGNTDEICRFGVRWIMWEAPLLSKYPEAQQTTPERLGTIAYTQSIPSGQRQLIRLNCN